MKKLTQLLLLLVFVYPLSAQDCGSNESFIEVRITTDNFPFETSWSLFTSDTVYVEVDMANPSFQPNTEYITEICVANTECVHFLIEDTKDDGIFAPGGFVISLNGEEIFSGNDFGASFTALVSCPPGFSCPTAIPVSEGEHSALQSDFWYSFHADSIGTYQISTCEINTCDTKIWVYPGCDNEITGSVEGTIFFDDNAGGCGLQAVATTLFVPGETYYIRIGDAGDDCEGQPINWNIQYIGPIIGCMDSMSCNFNPLATIDDGGCIAQDDPNCPEGADLILLQDVLESSVHLSTIDASENDCLIEENCLQGYGLRDIIRFSTHIQNIGELDYFIGDVTSNPDQFTTDNCHGHAHYDGYAEYLLFDENSKQIPIGVKNGFCVIDLECENGGTAKFGCNYMGLTAGCGDLYEASLECQWVDITDVDDGRYILVTRVNWDNAPDASGRVEKNIENNWAQVCIVLDRSSGELTMEVDENCEPYVDCAGVPYGSSIEDCTGVCGGSILRGDLDDDNTQTMSDAEAYVSLVLGDDITPTACNDLNVDGIISVYDAALLSDCLNFGGGHTHVGGGAHDHCNFPDGTLNINDTVALSIIDIDLDEKWIDIGIQNETTAVLAYQFKMSGIMVSGVESLVDPSSFPIVPKNNFDGLVIGISYQDSLIRKTLGVQPLCRIHYTSITDTEICIESVQDVVNDKKEQVMTSIDGACIFTTSAKNWNTQWNVKVQPNPFSRLTRLVFDANNPSDFKLTLVDLRGKIVRTYTELERGEVLIKKADLVSGIYYYRLTDGRQIAIGKFSVL